MINKPRSYEEEDKNGSRVIDFKPRRCKDTNLSSIYIWKYHLNPAYTLASIELFFVDIPSTCLYIEGVRLCVGIIWYFLCFFV